MIVCIFVLLAFEPLTLFIVFFTHVSLTYIFGDNPSVAEACDQGKEAGHYSHKIDPSQPIHEFAKIALSLCTLQCDPGF